MKTYALCSIKTSLAKVVLLGCTAVYFGSAAIASERFTLGRLGEEIIDSKQNIAFKRCPEYQAWQVNKCIGTMPEYTFAQANERAAQVASELGKPWRLPTLKELHGLFDVTSEKTTIASKFFPSDAGGSFWTSTKISSYPDSIWIVKFNSGELSEASKSKSLMPLRLVRSLN